MDSLFPMAAILARDGVAHQARSALPNAPVIPDDAPPAPSAPRAVRSRTVLAGVLEAAARAIAPPPRCTPSH